LTKFNLNDHITAIDSMPGLLHSSSSVDHHAFSDNSVDPSR